MTRAQLRFQTGKSLRWVITDSGLGGLSVCAAIERNIRHTGLYRDLRLIYFNAWPDPGSGYNALPDVQSRARVFDRALLRMSQIEPDLILIACNTLSILYELTEFRRRAGIPVLGIIDAGVDLFSEALETDPQSSIVLIGTRTTIESQVHHNRLVQRGIEDGRITAVTCHGLAAAIEKDPDSPTVADLIEKCAAEASKTDFAGGQLYAGLCCTHYGYVEGAIRSALERHSGRSFRILDPNDRLANSVAPRSEKPGIEPGRTTVAVEVISKVELDDNQRRAIARYIEPVSDVTAHALLSYTRDLDLF